MIWVRIICLASVLLTLLYVGRILLQARAMSVRSRVWRAQLEAAKARVAASGGRDEEATRQLLALLRRGSTS
jgi:hypothetical protein